MKMLKAMGVEQTGEFGWIRKKKKKREKKRKSDRSGKMRRKKKRNFSDVPTVEAGRSEY